MEFHDTVSDTTLIANAIQAALESSKVDGGNGKTDEGGIKEKVKDQAVGYIIGGTLGGLVTVATSVCMYFRNKVCGQTGENQQPNATAETHIEASTRPNLNPLQATVGYSTTNDEEELGLAKGEECTLQIENQQRNATAETPPPLRAGAMI